MSDIGIIGFTSSAASTSWCWNSYQVVGWNAQYDRGNGCQSRRKGKSCRFKERIVDCCAVEKSTAVLLLVNNRRPPEDALGSGMGIDWNLDNRLIFDIWGKVLVLILFENNYVLLKIFISTG